MLDSFFELISSIVAGVCTYIICKWLEEEDKR